MLQNLEKKLKPLSWLKVWKKIKGKSLLQEKIILKALGRYLSFKNTISSLFQLYSFSFSQH